MRSWDECRVTVRSHKADFLSENETQECVELMRVARYFMSGSDIACFTFVASGVFLVEIGQMPFSDFYPYGLWEKNFPQDGLLQNKTEG